MVGVGVGGRDGDWSCCVVTIDVCIFAFLQALDSGEKGHKITVAKILENKLCNRFANIAVCEFTSL